MEGNDVVAEDIVAWCNIGRDANEPRVPVGDEGIRSPPVGLLRRVDEAGTVDLEEAEGCLVNGIAWAVAVGQEVHDRAFMTVRPLGPLELDRIAGSYSDATFAGGGLFVADNIGCVVSAWVDKTVVLLVSRPSGNQRWVVGVWVLCWDVVAVGDAVDDDVRYMAVCGNGCN